MKKVRNRILALALALAMGLSLVACGGGGSGSAGGAASTPAANNNSEGGDTNAPAADGGHLDVGINADIGDIAPFGGTGTGRTYTKYTIYEYLLQFSEFGQTVDEMIRQVARDVEITGDKSARVTIYDYVEDAAGNHITAEDVKYSFDMMIDSSQLPKLNTFVDSITVVDDYTLDFTFTSSKVGTMEYVFCQVPIISKAAYEASDNGMATAPVSTAPYQVSDMVPGSYLDLVKNDNYWQKDESLRTYLAVQAYDSIRMHVITEATQLTIALQSGTIDAATVVGGQELDNFVNADGSAVSGFNALRQVGGVAYTVMFNTSSNSVFENLALRQAVCYALDNASILQGASNGAGDLTKTAATVIAADYNPVWDTEDYYDYDVEAAKALMAEAGYADGGFSIRLMVENTSEYNKMAEMMQAYLLQLGIETEILAYDSALFNTYRSENDQWDIRMNAIGTSDFVIGSYELAIGEIANKYLSDPVLDELYATAAENSTHTQDNVDALHYYIKDNAYAYGLYSQSTTSISVEGVQMVRHPWGQLIAGACMPED